MESPSNKVLCTCSKCSQNSTFEDGITHQGQYVHLRTWHKHLFETSDSSSKNLVESLLQLTFEEFPDLAKPKHMPSISQNRRTPKRRSQQPPDPDDVVGLLVGQMIIFGKVPAGGSKLQNRLGGYYNNLRVVYWPAPL
jgi:hypothetical protein